MDVQIQEMAIGDYDEVYELWQSTNGISVGDVDTRECIARFLAMSPGRRGCWWV